MTHKHKLIFATMTILFAVSSLVKAELELNQAPPLAQLADDVGAGSMVLLGIVTN